MRTRLCLFLLLGLVALSLTACNTHSPMSDITPFPTVNADGDPVMVSDRTRLKQSWVQSPQGVPKTDIATEIDVPSLDDSARAWVQTGTGAVRDAAVGTAAVTTAWWLLDGAESTQNRVYSGRVDGNHNVRLGFDEPIILGPDGNPVGSNPPMGNGD